LNNINIKRYLNDINIKVLPSNIFKLNNLELMQVFVLNKIFKSIYTILIKKKKKKKKKLILYNMIYLLLL